MYEFERLKSYITNEPRLKPFYEQAQEECRASNCQSLVVILEKTIENLIDAYESKCEDYDSIEKSVHRYLKKTCNL